MLRSINSSGFFQGANKHINDHMLTIINNSVLASRRRPVLSVIPSLQIKDTTWQSDGSYTRNTFPGCCVQVFFCCG
ncbi:hypothetical protein OIU79_018089 [Salix purpurea]|uniref:Uncharacterized protein n=1 Tax=Salix purpurea TaxID=77065 RepID=A0A9Q0WZ37_SALPP|nr:hypothetical protein OIU79_018089 [Salix purpurea]